MRRRFNHLTPRYVKDRIGLWFYELRNPDAPWLTADAIRVSADTPEGSRTQANGLATEKRTGSPERARRGPPAIPWVDRSGYWSTTSRVLAIRIAEPDAIAS